MATGTPGEKRRDHTKRDQHGLDQLRLVKASRDRLGGEPFPMAKLA
jgi:hypothetical protein